MVIELALPEGACVWLLQFPAGASIRQGHINRSSPESPILQDEG